MRGRQRNAAIAKKIRCAATRLPGQHTGAGLDRQNFSPASWLARTNVSKRFGVIFLTIEGCNQAHKPMAGPSLCGANGSASIATHVCRARWKQPSPAARLRRRNWSSGTPT